MTSTLTERLHEVMQAKGWTHADLMRVSGQSSSVVSQWLGKGSKAIKSIGKMEAAESIAAESGYAALWIAKGKGRKFTAPVVAAGLPAQAQALDEHELALLQEFRRLKSDVLRGRAIERVAALVIESVLDPRESGEFGNGTNG